jgi:hypothetical protein
MLERLIWIVADEAYYVDPETAPHLPSLEWVQLNKYAASIAAPCFLSGFCSSSR